MPAMDTRTQSIRKDLALRIFLAAAGLTLVVGPATWLAERRRVEAAIEERAALGVELLRARVRQLARESGATWQEVAPRALEGLVADVPEARVGRFAYVEVRDTDGRTLAAAGDPSRRGDGTVAVAAMVDDGHGKPLARIHGSFAVSEAAIADARRRVLVSVLVVVGIVASASLVLYPVVRRLVKRLSEMSVLLLDANVETLRVLGSAIAKRDSDTDAHNHRVTIYAVRLAEASGADDAAIRRLVKGAFLHDVGKIGVRDNILLKPGRLDAEEFEIMKAHVSHGLDIVADSSWLGDAREVIGSHHEQYEGGGYHAGLRGEAIPLAARLFAIADVFDALASERPYKKPMTVAESVAILRDGAGRHFDPALVARFADLAPALHAQFAADDAAARAELDNILARYFRTDLGVILRESGARP